jgi:hypothetical protein
MQEVSLTQFREMMMILAIVTGLVSSFVTLVGSWFMLKFRIGRHDEQIGELKKTITNGNGLVQQVATLQLNMVDRQRFDHIMFSDPNAVMTQLSGLHERLTRLESTCNERHATRRQPAGKKS